MKIIGKLTHALNSNSSVMGNLTHPALDSFVVGTNDPDSYIEYGIYEMVPTRDKHNALHIEYHPKVMGRTLELLQEWIGAQYKIELT